MQTAARALRARPTARLPWSREIIGSNLWRLAWWDEAGERCAAGVGMEPLTSDGRGSV